MKKKRKSFETKEQRSRRLAIKQHEENTRLKIGRIIRGMKYCYYLRINAGRSIPFFLSFILILILLPSVPAQTQTPAAELSPDTLKRMIVDLSRKIEVVTEQRDAALKANDDKTELIKRDNETINALLAAKTAFEALLAEKDVQIKTRDELLAAKDATIKAHEQKEIAQDKVFQTEKTKTAKAKTETKACAAGATVGAIIGGSWGGPIGAGLGAFGGCKLAQYGQKLLNIFK